MHWYELLGYLGAVFMFSTFYMKTMVPLRITGIAANILMVVYTATAKIYPVLILQSCLLPLNIYRLIQMLELVKRVKKSSRSDFSFAPLIPFMSTEHAKKGDVLFRRGERSNKLYLIQHGTIRLEEIGRTVSDGDVLGEIGILSASNERTATAICEDDTALLTMTEDKVLQLFYQNPGFGIFMVRLVIQRMLRNADPRLSVVPSVPAPTGV